MSLWFRTHCLSTEIQRSLVSADVPFIGSNSSGHFMSQNAPSQRPRQPGGKTHNRSSKRPRSSRDNAGDAETLIRLFGIHAVESALANPLRAIHRLLANKNAANRLAAAVQARGIEIEPAHSKDLARILGNDTVHQGVLLETAPLPAPSLDDLAARATDGHPLLVLDQVTDPHNVGAILRSAAVFGAGGLILTRRNSPPLAGALAKAASGALEHVPVLAVGNLAQALSHLNESGVWCLGLDGEADDRLEAVVPELAVNKQGMALVLGAEGRGLRQLTQQRVQQLCRLNTRGPMNSLNVSNAAAVGLHVLACAQSA